MYGYNYLNLSKAKEYQLEIVNRKATHIITGLTDFTELFQIEELAQINRLKDMAAERKASKLVKRQESKDGRILLQALAPLLPNLPLLATPLVPWQYIDTTGNNLSHQILGPLPTRK